MPAEQGLHTQHLETVSGHQPRRVHPQSALAVAHVYGIIIPAGDVREGSLLELELFSSSAK